MWIEAEDYAEQSGSQAAFYAMKGASGGRIVDNDWAGGRRTSSATRSSFPGTTRRTWRRWPRCGGSHIHRVSVNPVHDNFPSALHDGRVAFTRWEYNDRWVLHVQGLVVMNPDGTGTAALYGNNSFWPISMLHTRAVPGTTLVVSTLSGHHDVDQIGEIGLFDLSRGSEEADGCVRLWP